MEIPAPTAYPLKVPLPRRRLLGSIAQQATSNYILVPDLLRIVKLGECARVSRLCLYCIDKTLAVDVVDVVPTGAKKRTALGVSRRALLGRCPSVASLASICLAPVELSTEEDCAAYQQHGGCSD